MRERYQALIQQIVTATLEGQIRSKEQVYQQLQTSIEAGTGELFERCLAAALAALPDDCEDELVQAKIQRQQRALNLIVSEWQRWQKVNQWDATLGKLIESLKELPAERLTSLLHALDPNQPQPLPREQIRQLSQRLTQLADGTGEPSIGSTAGINLSAMALGLQQGLDSWQILESHLVDWIYEQNQAIGFDSARPDRGPWRSWANSLPAGVLNQIFVDLADNRAITTTGLSTSLSFQNWLALMVVWQRLQLGLVAWFDQQPYDPTAGKRLSIATFLTFTVVWSQLSERLHQLHQSDLAAASFQLALQVLRQFAQQSYFPLYGGLFTALSGESLQAMLDYLNQPLQQVPNTATKARILTLLGYSQRALGQFQRALVFHQQALEIAREAADRPCEIANLNHLSRTFVMQADYGAAVDASQRALILARQQGDQLGEANALANYGYSEVFQAQLETDRYESVLNYLQRGLLLSKQLGDIPSQALCAHSLGIAQVRLGQYPAAIDSLRQGLYIAQNLGDLSLQGLNYAYLSEAYRSLDNPEKAVATGSLGMYLLHQVNSQQWQYPAKILNILYGQLGAAGFQALLEQFRPQLLQQIGVDGYDYLPKLLAIYRQELSD